MTDLRTEWADDLDPAAVLPEYPRPQLVRDSYLNLNGRWEYAITDADALEPAEFDGTIVVPFSPEAPLSGVARQLRPDQRLWYRRSLTLPPDFRPQDGDHRVLLHFGAVDQTCQVFCNDTEVGSHTGGYLPFHCDITQALRDGENTLVVSVRDVTDTGHHSRGKQRLSRGEIWYTAQSGIWQTVWAECVPAEHVERLTITPRLDAGAVEVTVHSGHTGDAQVEVSAQNGDPVASATIPVGVPTLIPVPHARPWSPEDPYLYDLEVAAGADRVRGYFGMRSFGVGTDAKGLPRLLLNGKPYFHAGILDQGYWPDGLYTAPSDAAMIHDIATMKDLGFTMLRKHIKIEPLRWYYHCDRLGILVWQDMVNGGSTYRPAVVTTPAILSAAQISDHRYRLFGRADAEGRQRFQAELHDTVTHLRNVVGLSVWVPFNEGWGQFDAAETAAMVTALDDSRPVDHASGWHDQGAGDFHSLHVYFRRFKVPRRRDRRVLALTEYGGYSLRLDGHCFNDRAFGYRRYATAGEFQEAFTQLHTEQIVPAIAQGLSATVYTQLSDVEDELNGLLTYDRRQLKVPAEAIKAVNSRLRL